VPTRLPVTQQLTTKAQLDIGVYLQLLQHASAAAFLFSFLFLLLPSPCRFFVLLFSSFPTWILSLTPFSRHPPPPPPSPYRLPPAPDPPSFTQFPNRRLPFLFRGCSFPTVPTTSFLSGGRAAEPSPSSPSSVKKRPLGTGGHHRHDSQ
jgi:hypothetical protein